MWKFQKTLATVVVAMVGIASQPLFAQPYAYITNRSTNDVSIIDTASNTVSATIPVGSVPIGVAVDVTGSLVYVTNFSSNDVSVVETAGNSIVATIPVGANPEYVAINAAGTQYSYEYGCCDDPCCGQADRYCLE